MWHNLASGLAAHNMFVQTSTDDGASFGAARPGDAARLRRRTATCSAPTPAVPRASRSTRRPGGSTSPSAPAPAPPQGGPALGGCTAGASGSLQFNIVSATREWVAYSDDNSPGSWKQSLAFDKSRDQPGRRHAAVRARARHRQQRLRRLPGVDAPPPTTAPRSSSICADRDAQLAGRRRRPSRRSRAPAATCCRTSSPATRAGSTSRRCAATRRPTAARSGTPTPRSRSTPSAPRRPSPRPGCRPSRPTRARRTS